MNAPDDVVPSRSCARPRYPAPDTISANSRRARRRSTGRRAQARTWRRRLPSLEIHPFEAAAPSSGPADSHVGRAPAPLGRASRAPVNVAARRAARDTVAPSCGGSSSGSSSVSWSAVCRGTHARTVVRRAVVPQEAMPRAGTLVAPRLVELPRAERRGEAPQLVELREAMPRAECPLEVPRLVELREAMPRAECLLEVPRLVELREAMPRVEPPVETPRVGAPPAAEPSQMAVLQQATTSPPVGVEPRQRKMAVPDVTRSAFHKRPSAVSRSGRPVVWTTSASAASASARHRTATAARARPMQVLTPRVETRPTVRHRRPARSLASRATSSRADARALTSPHSRASRARRQARQPGPPAR